MGSITPKYSLDDQTYGPKTNGAGKDSPYSHGVIDWEHYHLYRPLYGPSIWNLLTAYHRGPLDTVHELGAGGGAGSNSLLRCLPQGTIAHLIVSDPNDGNLHCAARLLSQQGHASRTHLDFRAGTAEQTLLAPGEYVDATFICMALHWVKMPVLLDRLAEGLRPGGTFMAIGYNPYPVILNNPKANLRLREYLTACYAQVSEDALEKLREDAWIVAAGQTSKGVAMVDPMNDDERFEDVVRIEINTQQQQQPWWFPPALMRTLGVEPVEPRAAGGNFGPVQRFEEHGDWARLGMNPDWIRGLASTMLGSLRAGFNPDNGKEAWAALEAVLDGPVDICWQAFVVLARRR